MSIPALYNVNVVAFIRLFVAARLELIGMYEKMCGLGEAATSVQIQPMISFESQTNLNDLHSCRVIQSNVDVPNSSNEGNLCSKDVSKGAVAMKNGLFFMPYDKLILPLLESLSR